MKINGKRILITGAAKRIGRALVLGLSECGAKILLHYNHSKEAASDLFDLIGGTPKGHQLLKADLSKPCEVDAIFDQINGPIDVLINNAATFEMKTLAEESDEEARRQFEINFWSPLRLMREIHLRDNPHEKCIINILDQRITKVDPLGGSYPLSKKALAEASKAAAIQFAPKTRVNAIAPGVVLAPENQPDWTMEKSLTQVPSGKPVDMEDLVNACIFLVENNSINGQTLFVDGGQHL